MKGILIIGGDHPARDLTSRLVEEAQIIIAADSGFDYAWNNGIEIDYVVGDMDSTSYREIIESMPKEKVLRMPEEKDETDTEIGLAMLKELGAAESVIIGGGGGRLDHLLGIVTLFHREIRPDEWYTDKEAVWSIDRRRIFEGLKGKTVSFFPVGEEICRMRSSGLKWPLDQLVWKPGDAGISNVVMEDSMMVEPLSGRLICIYEYE
ncbi:MAG: thiamine diphosphokinase [Spirochaetota bacterium]|nr:thiamine diphosphokinase [Spirochaetota bacterium]